MDQENEPELETQHRFLDEAGDTTFYGKGKRLIVGELGVSRSFSIGMLKVAEDLPTLRQKVRDLQDEVAADKYLNTIPSVQKKIAKNGFFFHATDDPPEVRQIMFKFLAKLDVSLEVIVARKIEGIYARKHNGREAEFYADVLSHLIKNKLKMNRKLVLNIAQRGNCTSNHNLSIALEKAKTRARQKVKDDEMVCDVVFNVQNQYTEPILNIADYLCWPVQRVFERGEMRYYDFIGEKIRLVVDLYDQEKYEGWKHYYKPGTNPLTAANKLGPHSA